MYLLYFQSIHAFDLKLSLAQNSTMQPSLATASIFITAPSDSITLPFAMLDQVVVTGILVFAILFIMDNKCYSTSFVLQTLMVGGAIFSVGVACNYNCGAILNPGKRY